MIKPLRVLMLEDNPADAELIQFEMQEAGLNFIPKVVTTEKEFVSALRECLPDIILSDYDLPVYDGAKALAAARTICPGIPFILVTGAISEDLAIDTLTSGAKDYVMKSRLHRLAPAIRRALTEAEELRARRNAQEELKQAHRELEDKVRLRTLALEEEMAAMSWLQKIGSLYIHDANPVPILTEIVDAAIAISKSDFGNIQLLDPETSTLRIVAHRGFDKGWLDFWNQVAEGQGCCGAALERGERVIIEDVEQSPVFIGTVALDIQRKAGIKAVQSTPLMSRSGKPLGMFSTHYKEPHRPDDNALRRLDLLARHAADIMERIQAEEIISRSQSALRESDRRYSSLFANKINGIAHCRIITDEQGKPIDHVILSVNEAYERIVGLKKADIEGRLATEVFPDIKDYAQDFIGIYGRVALEGGEIKFEQDLKFENKYLSVYAYCPTHGEFIAIFTDITEQKRNEELLRESEERFRSAFEDSAIAMAITGLEGKFLKVNSAYCRMLMIPAEEMIGQPFAKYTHPEDLAINIPGLEALSMWKSRSFRMEKRYIRKDGKIIWGDMSASAVCDSQGRPLYMITHIQDITERKQAEEALLDAAARKHAAQYARTLIEVSIDPLVTISPEGKITDVNKATIGATGASREELIGTDFSDYFTEPDKAQEGYKQVFAKGYVTDYPLTIRHRDGKLMDVLYNASLYKDTHGNVQGVFAAARDITVRKRAESELRKHRDSLEAEVNKRTKDLRESEERYKGVVENTNAIILRLTTKGVITFANRRALDFFGYPAEELIGKHAVGTVIPPKESSGRDLAKMVEEIAADPDAFHTNTNENICKDGRRVWLEWTNSGIYSSNGRLKGFLSVGIDATARRLAEDALRASEERLAIATSGAKMGIYEWNITTGKIFWSEQLARLFGLHPTSTTSHEYHYQDWRQRIHPEDLLRLETELQCCRTERKSFVTEYRVIWPDRSMHWIADRGVFHYDSDGRCTRMLGISMDIDERKHAEGALLASEQRLALATSGTQIGIFDRNLVTDEIIATEQNARLLGLITTTTTTTTTTLSRHYHYRDWVERVHPEDLTRVEAEMSRCMTVHAPFESEYRVVWPDASVHWISARGMFQYDDQGAANRLLGILMEITERKETENALHESEQRFRALSETSPIGVGVSSADGVLLYTNPAYEYLLGYNQGELLGKKASDLYLNPDDRLVWFELMKENHAVRNAEIRLRRKDGDLIWVSINTSYIHFNGAQAVMGTIQDITEPKQAEEELRESAMRLQLTLQISAVGTFEVDLVNGEGRWNEVEYELLGLKPGSVPASPEMFFRYVHPQDIGKLRAQWEEAAQTGYLDAAFRVIRADGQERWLAGKGRFMYAKTADTQNTKDKGPPLRFLGVNFDVTARKQAEEELRESTLRLQLAIAGSNGAEWEISADEKQDHGFGEKAKLSPLCKRFIGFTDDEFPNSVWAWRERIHPDDLQAIAKATQAHIEKLTPSYNIEYRIRHKDGTWRHLLSTGRLQRDRDGRPLCWVGIDWDITERRKEEQKLLAQAEQLS